MAEGKKRKLFDKMAFFRDCGYEPHPGQRDIHLATEPRRVVACGVRWGKTYCAAMEGLAAAMQPAKRSVGWVVGPTYDIADRVFREIQVHALERVRHHVITNKESERLIVIRNMAGGESEIRAKSAESQVSLLGEGLDWLIIDEASRLKPNIWESHLSQRLIDKKGWALLISTPKGKGYFYDLYRRGQAQQDPQWRSWNQPSWTNPLLDRTLIDGERARIPERVFRQEYGAEFVEGSGAVFRNVRECATGQFRDPEKGRKYVAGLDLAKVEDYTVLSILDDKKNVVFVDRFHKVDWAIQILRIKAALDRFGEAEVYVDSTGSGEPIFETLRRDGINAKAYQFTQQSKAALIDNLALMFEQRSIVIPKPETWPEGIAELEDFEYSVTESGNHRTGASGSGHDDCVVSLALAAWHLRPRREPYQGFGIPGCIIISADDPPGCGW